MEEVTQAFEHIAKHSSKFYELVPMGEQKDAVTKPIQNQYQLQQIYERMDSLVNVELTSRMLLGALHRQYEMHPMQYIYNSMNVKISPLADGDPECDLIRAYCLNTAASPANPGPRITRIRIFKIERRGEAERFEPVAAKLGNRKLLFHGSKMPNFLGLMAQGMRIAPPEAPTTGFMFGKGCYFADMLQKSMSYSVGGFKHSLLLLCDVALGKEKKLYRAEYVEKLEAQFQSVKGCGRYGPDFKQKKVTTPQGYSVPMGTASEYPEPPQET